MTSHSMQLVPHNRWDLLRLADPSFDVSVIIVHYRQQADLQRLLRALDQQTLPPAEIIITDDGSPHPPAVSASRQSVQVLTQPDEGFRAARARNRGAEAATGDILVFLDADCVPHPEMVEALTRHVAVGPDVLAVGKRLHADLRRLPPGGDPAAMPQLPNPQWLADGYQNTENLLHSDGRSFRYVISAVLACRQTLYWDVGGFDERYQSYGGEDWDLAYRAWNNGAILVHEPDAVVWHNGAEPGSRSDSFYHRNQQAIRLASLIPEPATRGAAFPTEVPDVLVDVIVNEDPVGQIKTLHSLARQSHRDLAVQPTTPLNTDVAKLYSCWLHRTWSPEQILRARAHVIVRAPLKPNTIEDALGLAVAQDVGCIEICSDGQLIATLRTTRLLGRQRRWSEIVQPETIEASLGSACLEIGAASSHSQNLEDWFAADGRQREE